MAWRDTLLELREDLRQAMSQRYAEAGSASQESLKDQEELYQAAASLGIAQLLVDLNQVLLDGGGIVECSSNPDYFDDEEWFLGDPEGGDDEDDDDADDLEYASEEVVRFSLRWDDDDYSVDVELGKTEEGRIYLLVNDEEVRQQRELLEKAVIVAFREEMDF